MAKIFKFVDGSKIDKKFEKCYKVSILFFFKKP